MVVSPASYPIRLGLYELAMMVWDVVMRTHEILAHTGYVSPHAEQFYPDGELRLPNEIDEPLITLGGTVDAAFRAALAAAFDPFGNLDQDQDVIGAGHSVSDPNYPYYPVLRYHADGTTEGWEFHRPWAWPDVSRVERPGMSDTTKPTPTETYNPFKSFGEGPDEAYKPLRPGPYPIGTMPDVFFRLDAPVDGATRSAYEQAQHPWETDVLNEHIGRRRLGLSPLGDPVPFSCYLIGQLANDTGYSTQFNLDSDRAFAYLTWDWIRNKPDPKREGSTHTGILGLTYATPVVPPESDPRNSWDPANALLLDYKDKPKRREKPRPSAGPPR
jgi:hypothetical protein